MATAIPYTPPAAPSPPTAMTPAGVSTPAPDTPDVLAPAATPTPTPPSAMTPVVAAVPTPSVPAHVTQHEAGQPDALVLDEDDMASDSAAKAPSQQSVAAFVPALIAGMSLAYPGIAIAGTLAAGRQSNPFTPAGKTAVLAVEAGVGTAPTGAGLTAHLVNELGEELIAVADLIQDGETFGKWTLGTPLVIGPDEDEQTVIVELVAVGSSDPGEWLAGHLEVAPRV